MLGINREFKTLAFIVVSILIKKIVSVIQIDTTEDDFLYPINQANSIAENNVALFLKIMSFR